MMLNTLEMSRRTRRAAARMRRTGLQLGVGLAVCGLLASAGCGRYGSPIRPGAPRGPEAMGAAAAIPAEGGIQGGAAAPADPECEEEEE